ncbi:antitoxin [Sporichthya sp.]|uniref:antitoxin n=1 Tax=Sporichthya sp. TaxID=65475 RepID=UPI0017EA568F|nr:antitoxin [Sporichthya sp.]MBA3742738.1 antitoxin [Sporichthya sp.]
MGKLDELKAKAKAKVTENRDKIESGLEKAGNMVNQKTHGKHGDKIDKGLEKAKEGLDRAEGKDQGDPAPPMATGPAEPPQPTVPPTTPTTPPTGPPMG